MEYSDLIGVPYKPRGRDRSGMDCYGVVLEWFRRLGVELADVTGPLDAPERNGWCRVTTPQEGDVCAFSWTGGDAVEHCGVYLSGGKVLHCREPIGVFISPLKRFKSWLIGVYRLCRD